MEEPSQRFGLGIDEVLRSLAACQSQEEALRLLAESAARSVGAEGGAVVVLRPESGAIEVAASHGYAEDRLLEFAPLTVMSGLPLTEAVRLGEPVESDGRWDQSRAVPRSPDRVRPSSFSQPLRVAGEVIGALGVSFDPPRPVSADERAFLAVLADCAALLVRGVRLQQRLDGEQARYRALARLAALLTGAGSVREVTQLISQAAWPMLGARYVIVGLVSGTGKLRLQFPEGTPSPVVQQPDELDLADATAMSEAVRSETLVFVPDAAAGERRHPGTGAVREALGIRALAAVPLRTGDGRVIGALEVVWSEDRALSAALLEDLQAVAELCACSVERARLGEEAAIQAREAVAVAALTRAVAAARTSDEAVQAVVDNALDVLESASANLGFPVPGGVIEVRHDATLDKVMASRYQRQRLTDDLPLPEAFRSGQPVYAGDREEFARRYPSVAADIAELGLAATAAVPVRNEAGQVIAVFGAAWTRPQDFDAAARARMETLANVCSQALHRAALTERQESLVRELREARRLDAIPAVPRDPGPGAARGARGPLAAVTVSVALALFAVLAGFIVVVAVSLRAVSEPGGSPVAWDRAGALAFVVLAAGGLWLQRHELGLRRQLRASGNRAERLRRLAAELNAEATPQGIGQCVLETFPGVLGVRDVALATLRDDADEFDWIALKMTSPVTESWYQRLRPDAPPGSSAMTDALRSATPIIMRSEAEYARRYPHNLGVPGTRIFGSAVVWPLRSLSGPFGVLTVSFSSKQALSSAEVDFIGTVAELVAQALTRARRYASERDAAQILQRAVMPESDVRQLDGLSIAAAYRPAERAGGDWYDVVPLPGGELLVTIGDVAGHGMAAAEQMVRLRYATLALAAQGYPPDRLLGALNTTILLRDGFATSAVVLIDNQRRWLWYAAAGHPPAIYRNAAATRAFPLPVRPGPALGMTSQAAYSSTEIALAAGDILALYTDGLIEQRGQTMDEGLDQLADALTAIPRDTPLDRACDEILTACLQGRKVRDDVCLVLFRIEDNS